jgi:hypothetical protein
MPKTKPIMLRLVLISALALAATAITTTTATATPAESLFSFCHKVGGTSGKFTNSTCSTSGTGEYLLAYADNTTTLLLCEEEATSVHKWTNLGCDVLSSGGNTGKFETVASNVATPSILGVPLDPATLKATAGGLETKISCTSGTFKAQPEAGGAISNGKLEYSNCTVSGQTTGCTVLEPIDAEFTGKLLAADKVLYIGAKSSHTTKEDFVEVEYKGSSCAVKGDIFPVHGQQYCTAPAEILTLKTLQTLECKATESSLKLGAEKASYENKVSLDASSGEAWATLLVTP